MFHTDVQQEDFQKIANRVSINTIIGNIILTLVKLLTGIFAHSHAMFSDAIHSLSDVLSTIVVMIGIKLASKESDKEHPYGHERLECVAAIILAVVLFVTGLSIGGKALDNIIHKNTSNIQIPGIAAVVMAIISIVSKEAMFWYTKVNAIRIDSGALMADAWHHRSDAFSSIGALIGIVGARQGFLCLDAIAGLAICGFILKVAYDVFRDAVVKMVDHACDETTERAIYDCVMEHEHVLQISWLRTRIFGNKIYVNVEIQIDGSNTLLNSYEISKKIHDEIEKNFLKVKHIVVQVRPFDI